MNEDTRKWVEQAARRQALLEGAFSMIQDPKDWRNPIDTFILRKDYEICAEACVHFTATELEMIGEGPGDCVHVRAVGYRNGPAGP